jgi:hypothetical protein
MSDLEADIGMTFECSLLENRLSQKEEANGDGLLYHKTQLILHYLSVKDGRDAYIESVFLCSHILKKKNKEPYTVMYIGNYVTGTSIKNL